MGNSCLMNVISESRDLSPAQELTAKIKGALFDIANSFVYIGFLLAECQAYESYRDWGYSSIYDYASSELGFKKSSVNNFINVCRTFSSNFSSCGEPLPFSMIMKDDYKSFNYSQLVEMLSMSDKQRSLCSPDMTVRQLRQLKKSDDSFQTSGNEVEVVDVPVQMSGNEVEVVDVPVQMSGNYIDLDDELIKDFISMVDEQFIEGDFFDIGQFYLDKFAEYGYKLVSIKN